MPVTESYNHHHQEMNPTDDEMKKEAIYLKEQISASCDAELAQLWEAFLEFDHSMDGKIDGNEIEKMLREFDKMASDEDIEAYLYSLGDKRHNGMEFMEFVNWYNTQRQNPVSRASSDALHATLTARYTLRRIPFMNSNTYAKRLDAANHAAVVSAVEYFKQTIFNLGKWKLQQQVVKLRKDEVWPREIAKRHIWEKEELDKLRTVFFGYLEENRLTKASLADIVEIAMILGYATPGPVLIMTKYTYPRMFDFETFLEWWFVRSGRAKKPLL